MERTMQSVGYFVRLAQLQSPHTPHNVHAPLVCSPALSSPALPHARLLFSPFPWVRVPNVRIGSIESARLGELPSGNANHPMSTTLDCEYFTGGRMKKLNSSGLVVVKGKYVGFPVRSIED